MGSLKYHDVPMLRREFGLELFAETGTHEGFGMMEALACNFRHCISIESNPELLEAARKHISEVYPEERYSLRAIASPDGVNWILKQLGGPTLWWLDAHFPRLYDDPTTGDELPLLGEVTRIVNAGRTKDVILADDMQIWLETSHPFPSEHAHMRGRHDEIARVVALLEPTHLVYICREVSGFLLAIPRCPS